LHFAGLNAFSLARGDRWACERKSPQTSFGLKNHVRSIAPKLLAFLVCFVLVSSHAITSFFLAAFLFVTFETAVRSKVTLLLPLSR